MLNSSFWPGVCAFASILFAAIAIIDFGVYVATRYRERYLQEASTELDDVLIQIPASRVLDISIAFSGKGFGANAADSDLDIGVCDVSDPPFYIALFENTTAE